MSLKQKQKGSVSLFVVIFAALLIITIVTAFIRIMIQDQMQATASDLSKSALDSAQAGVEDAKRAIVEYYQPNPARNKPDCSTVGDGVNPRCDQLRDILAGTATDGWTDLCNVTERAGVATLVNKEYPVKTTDADNSLNQAYTCVKIQMNPPNIVGSLTPGTSRIYHLKSKDNAVFDQIKLQWYAQKGQTLDLGDGSSPYKLPDKWPTDPPRPAVMKVQLLQYKTDFQVSQFDSDSNYNSSLFLLPSTAGSSLTAPASFLLSDRLKRNEQTANQVACHETPTASRYACEVILNLPSWSNAPDLANRDAYLKLSQFYSAENNEFNVTLLDGTTGLEVRTADVQVAVDSTGRANDIFKRIRSRIDLGVSSVPSPDAVDVTRSLCKEFSVTNDAAYFPNNSACPTLP